MLVAQGFWDRLQWDNVAAGLDRLYYVAHDWVSDAGPGTLLPGAILIGVIDSRSCGPVERTGP